MFRSIAFALLTVVIALPAAGQTRPGYTVTGNTLDAEDGAPLPGVNVVLSSREDTTRIWAAITDAEGAFTVRVPEQNTYRLRASFVGYKPVEQLVTVDSTENRVGTLKMEVDVLYMKEVLVEDIQERFRMKGDTTVFNADAFKVNPDATAENLVEKLPGVVIQDGQVQAQGEQVQRVTVDGREFFGSDPSVALRNLPADIIQNIEVFDRQSDQAQFSGFRDGNTEKTINIVTRTGMSNGQFGRVYGGYGADERYITGGNINIFDASRRISIIGLANNLNQQNFAFEDLLGMMGGGGFGGGRGGMMRMGGPRGGGPRGGGGFGGGGFGGGGGGFNPRDFLVGSTSGLNNTAALGINFSDEWGQKAKFSGSYFFNRMGNTNEALLDRQLFLPDAATQFYSEVQSSTSTNYNHRLNARFEYDINDANSILVRPRISFQDNDSRSLLFGANMLASGDSLNRTINDYQSDNFGFTSSTDILYRHRFAPGRTLSANLEIGLNSRWGDVDQAAITDFFAQVDDEDRDTSGDYDQEIGNESAGRSFSLDLDYTEPFGENNQLRLSYEPTYAKNLSERFAYERSLTTGEYVIFDPSFSSLFDNDVLTQRAGATFRHRVEDRYEVQIGLEYQNERLMGDQTYPFHFELDRTFHSFLPEAEVEVELGEQTEVEIGYRTNTNTPSISQLQDYIDNTNPLYLRSGNPNLKPSYSHQGNIRFRTGNWQSGRMFFAFANVNYSLNPIGTASLLAPRDTVLAQGVTLRQGAQYSYPVNLDEASFSARSFLVLGTPFPLIKSNLNIRGGLSYSHQPGLVNGTMNLADQYGVNTGITVSSNISERLDFTLSYGADYTIATNSFYEQLDENYWRHFTSARFTWLPIGGLVLETDLTYNDYVGLDNDLYPSTFILKQDAAEVKLVLGDILNQETGINRSITEMYIEDSRTQVLGRYVLLNLSYRLRNFRV